MRLKNKVALITGGNSGIGLATARVFLAEGARVAITGRNPATLDAAARELGPELLALPVEVTDTAAMDRAVARVVERFGALDIVFANAGIIKPTPLGGTSWESFEEVVGINLNAAFFTVQSALPHLKPGASVVFNGSTQSVLSSPGFAAYAVSKAGLRALVRSLAAELSPRGIRVNMVSPGAIRTTLWGTLAPTPELNAAMEEFILKGIPRGRMGEAEEVAKTVLFLASDDASNIHAVELFVDGGTTGTPMGAPAYRL